MAQPTTPFSRPPETEKQSPEEIRSILNYLFRESDVFRSGEYGGRHPFGESKSIPLPIEGGRTVNFPALLTLIREYGKRYPKQTQSYLVDRAILQAALDAPGSKGATIFFGIYPDYELTLTPWKRFLWKFVYWLHQFLPREPRQLIIRGLGENLKDLPLAHEATGANPPRPSAPGVPEGFGSAFSVQSARDEGDGGEMTGTTGPPPRR